MQLVAKLCPAPNFRIGLVFRAPINPLLIALEGFSRELRKTLPETGNVRM